MQNLSYHPKILNLRLQFNQTSKCPLKSLGSFHSHSFISFLSSGNVLLYLYLKRCLFRASDSSHLLLIQVTGQMSPLPLNPQRLVSYLSPSRCSWSTWFPHEMYTVGMIHPVCLWAWLDSIISNPGQYKIQKLYTLWSPILKESAIWLYLTVGKKKRTVLTVQRGKVGQGGR